MSLSSPRPQQNFISKLRPPSALRSSPAQSQRMASSSRASVPSANTKTSKQPLARAQGNGRSRIPPPQARMSFLSPKDVWSPLAPSPKRAGSLTPRVGVMAASLPQRPKFQLCDPGVVTSARASLPRRQSRTAIPRPQARSRLPRPAPSPIVQSSWLLPEPTPTSAPLTSQGSNQSAASSACSSASSLARHRAIHVRRRLARNPSSTASSLSTLSEGSFRTAATVSDNVRDCVVPLAASDTEDAYQYEPKQEQLCTPYLVPAQGPPVTLQWERDPEADMHDEAEEIWRQMETNMGRRLRGSSLRERGRWVVRLQEELVEAQSMLREESAFSISAYMSESTPTALFDMSAPLIPSVSSSACTPQNTPCLRRETLQRGKRVRRRMGDISEMVRGASESSCDGGSVDTESEASAARPPSIPMYRLDSQVVSALEALRNVVDSPDLDMALGIRRYGVQRTPKHSYPLPNADEEETGLGLGMSLHLDSVYSLAMITPRLRAGLSQGSHGEVPLAEEMVEKSDDQGEEGEMAQDVDCGEVLRIVDLDTGLTREVRLDSIGEGDLAV